MKKMMFLAATAAAVMSSCSQTEVVEPTYQNVPNSPNAISFITNTTRAVIDNLDSLQADGGGFQVFGEQNGTPGWYNDGDASASTVVIDGDNYYYAYKDGAWNWNSKATNTVVAAPFWPTNLGANNMNFYAMYPKGAASFGTSGIQQTVIVAADRFAQVDHLSAVEIGVSNKPDGGRLSLNFEHIMSKVNVSAQTDNGWVMTVAKVTFFNVNQSATYTYKGTTPGWGVSSTPMSFLYRDDNISTADAGASQSLIQNSTATALDGNLMLIPQTFSQIALVGNPTGDLAAIKAGTYIQVVYRIVDENGKDIVGKAATNQYVKAVFPIRTATTGADWEEGHGYIYNLLAGNTTGGGGYHEEEEFVDEEGDKTGEEIPGVTPGDPVFQTNRIHFNVGVADWVDTTIGVQ